LGLAMRGLASSASASIAPTTSLVPWEDQHTVGKAQKLAYQQKGNNIAASGRCDCVVRISRQFPFCLIA
jgi:hypothetical protein